MCEGCGNSCVAGPVLMGDILFPALIVLIIIGFLILIYRRYKNGDKNKGSSKK